MKAAAVKGTMVFILALALNGCQAPAVRERPAPAREALRSVEAPPATLWVLKEGDPDYAIRVKILPFKGAAVRRILDPSMGFKTADRPVRSLINLELFLETAANPRMELGKRAPYIEIVLPRQNLAGTLLFLKWSLDPAGRMWIPAALASRRSMVPDLKIADYRETATEYRFLALDWPLEGLELGEL